MGFLAPVVAAVGGFFASTGIAATLVKSAIGIGLNLAIGALTTKNQKRDQQPAPQGIQLELRTGSVTPRSVAMGRVASRGQRTWFKETGTNNVDFNFTDVLSDGGCHQLVGVLVDGGYKAVVSQPVTGSEHARYHVADFGALIVLRWHDGRIGQAADTDMVAVSGGDITADDVGEGLCYIAGTITYDQGTFQSIPEFLYVFDGYRLYDPRLDSTVGGSGSHRLADPSTWAFSENPALQFLNYALGIRAGSDTAALGGFTSFSGLDLPSVMVAATACDEDVGGEARYACSAIIEADGSDHRSKVAAVFQAMAGWPVERGGRLGVLAGTAQTPVVTFTDDDLVVDAQVEWSRIRPRDERVNQVRGQFLSEDAGWTLDDYPVLGVAADQASDGELLEASFDLPMVRFERQAQRIASIRQRESRYGSATVTLPMPFVFVDAGDWVVWNSARYGSWIYRVDAIQQSGSNVLLSLRAVDAGIYGDPSFGTYTPPAAFTGPPAFATNVANFQVSPAIIPGQIDEPGVLATWDAPNDPRVDAVLIQGRIVGTTEALPFADLTPEDGEKLLGPLTGGADWEFRCTISTTPTRLVTWSPWIAVQTQSTFAWPEDVDVNLSDLSAEIQGTLAQANSINPYEGIEERFIAGIEGALRQIEDKRIFAETGHEFDPATGTWKLFAADPVTGDKTELQLILNQTDSKISLSVQNLASVQYVDDRIAETLEPDFSTDFDTDAAGFTGTNASVTHSGSIITVSNTGANASTTKTGLSVTAADSPLVSLRIRRTAGATSSWPISLDWSGSAGASSAAVAFSEPVNQSAISTVTVDLSDNADWTGTVDTITINTGGAGEAFEIDRVTIGPASALAAEFETLNARLQVAELDIDGLQNSITQTVSSLVFNAFVARADGSGDIVTVDGTNWSAIAKQTDLDTTLVRLDSVEQQIVANEEGAVIRDVAESVVGFVNDIGGVLDTINERAVRVHQSAVAERVLTTKIDTDVGAVAQSVTALQAQVGDDLQSSITELQQAVANESEARATAISGLTTTVDNNTSQIATEAQARADGDSANASVISGLQSTVDGNTASLGVLQSSINGVEVRFGVVGTINGVTGGFQFTGIEQLDGSVSYNFEINGNVIVDGSLSANALQANSLEVLFAAVNILTISTRLQNPSGSVVLDMRPGFETFEMALTTP